MKRKVQTMTGKFTSKALSLMAFMAIMATNAFAQTNPTAGLTTGLTTAKTTVGGQFDNVANLLLAVGAIIGLVGGIRVFVKWQNGDQDVNKGLAGWLGACIFLVLAGGILKAVFGL